MNSQSIVHDVLKALVGAVFRQIGIRIFVAQAPQRRQRGAARPLVLGGIALVLVALVWLQYSDNGPPVAGAVVKRSSASTPASASSSASTRATDAPGARATSSPVGPSSSADAAQDGAILELQPRRKLEPQEREAFAAHRWLPPAPPPVAPAPPPKPVAPPLPYRFVGKSKTEAGWSVFLARGEQTHIAIANTTLEGTYRIAAIQPPVMKLLYLPLNQEQTLDIGPENQ